MALTDIPTCRARITQDAVRDLVRLIIQRHFFDLPERKFLFLYAPPSNDDLELHTIAIDDGRQKATHGQVWRKGRDATA
jgi:hypothetical protein